MKIVRTAFTSSATYVFIAMFLVGGLQSIIPVVPAHYLPIVEGVLGLLGLFLHANTKQQLTGQIAALQGN